jgi:PAS domain S-box-containing protein
MRDAGSKGHVLDKIAAFVGLMDRDGTLLEANQAALEVAGLSARDVIGKKLWDCYWWSYSPESREQLKRAHRTALQGEDVRHEVQIRVAEDRLIWIDFQLAALRDETGRVSQLVPSGIELTARREAEDNLKRSYDTYLNLIQNAPLGVYLVDADFRLIQVSAGAQKVFAGIRPLIGRDFEEILRQIWTEPFASEAVCRFRRTLQTGETFRSEDTTERRADIDDVESYDWQIQRVTLPDGTHGVVCYFYDLTERKRHERQVGNLMKEVNHRAKNMLSLVQAVARQTAAKTDPSAFIARFGDRLQALAASQDLLIESNWTGATLDALIRSQLAHFKDSIGDRIRLQGPAVTVTASSAQTIGMAIHELATNAGKYGSLSNSTGRVEIQWEVLGDGPGKQVVLSWTESDGPQVKPPSAASFGTTVIRDLTRLGLGGDVQHDFAPSGVSWVLKAPADRVLETPLSRPDDPGP